MSNIELMNLKQAEEALDTNFIVTHDDADGITSAVLLSEAFNINTNRIKFTKKFGEYITPNDIMLDMRPLEGFKGICIDHHPDHPDTPEYTLIWDKMPASLIVFNLYRNHIPKEHWWKVVVGASGDGQAHQVPSYIWQLFPDLLLVTESRYWSGTSYKMWSISAYARLSAAVNATGRSRKPMLGYMKLLNSDKIDDILSDVELDELRYNLAKRVNDIVNKEARIYSMGPLRIVFYNADEKLGGRIAAKLMEEGITILTINESTSEVSIRGDLTRLLVEELNKLNIGKFGGHAGFAGGELTMSIGPSILSKLLNRIINNKEVNIPPLDTSKSIDIGKVLTNG